MMGADLDSFSYPDDSELGSSDTFTDPDILDEPNSTLLFSSNVNNNDVNISGYNHSDNGREQRFTDGVNIFIIAITEFTVFIFGAVGNGAVIWLLGFCIKRNPFITYILNLAVADLGVLLSIIVNTSRYTFIARSDTILMVSFYLILLMYSASQFFVTAICIDRCVAVFFPLWHQCKRPPRLSTIICALIWVLSILLTAISGTLKSANLYATRIDECYQFIANAVLCLPVMSIATVCLFIKVCLKVRQHRRGRLLIVVLLTLLFFLLFGFPLNVIYIISVLGYVPVYMRFGAALLACLNSSVNPIIYFLVGRQWKSRHRQSMKIILQKVFKEEELYTEETAVEIRV